MNVHFGVVKKYFPQKGFGFVSHPLASKVRRDVFLHITNVQKSNKDIADKLSSYEEGDDIYFYYEAEITPKGEQVKRILPTDGISEFLKSNLNDFTQKLECLWQDIETSQPIWLCDVTQDLIGTDALNKLKIERESLKNKKKEVEEIKRKETERIEEARQKLLEIQRQRKIENEERKKQLELQEQQRKVKAEEWKKQLEEQERQRRTEAEERERQRKSEAEEQERQRKIKAEEQERQRKIEDEEFELLVAEIEPKRFTMSAQVSNYIVKHRLGDKYKHISGILVMENDSSSWNFNGGFPPKIYAKLCLRIGLGNKGTNSRVVGFTPFKDL